MLNRVSLIGRITKDPELRQAGDRYCCNFTLAVGRRFAKDGQQQADFIGCVVWGQTANFLSSYIKKGYLLAVEGRLQTRSYDGHTGKVYVTEVYCESIDNLTPKSQASNYQAQQQVETTPAVPDVTFEDSFMDTPGIELTGDELPYY